MAASPVSEYPWSRCSAICLQRGRTDRRGDALRRSAGSFQAAPPPPGVTTVTQKRWSLASPPLGLWGHKSLFNSRHHRFLEVSAVTLVQVQAGTGGSCSRGASTISR